MTTLAEFMIIVNADNHPPMLEKSMYDSWKSRMKLYMKNRANWRMILNSVQNGPLGLSLDVYAIVNHHKVSKEIWDRVKLFMQGRKLSLQERECKLYDEFDKFSFVKGETLYQYYWRFGQLINNMNVINMSMRPVQVNKKLLNSLSPEWSKFVTDVKLARDLHTTNYDQFLTLPQNAYHTPSIAQQPKAEFSQLDSGLAVPSFLPELPRIYGREFNYLRFTQLINNMNIYNMKMEQFQVNTKFLNSLPPEWRDDPIACLNKAMTYESYTNIIIPNNADFQTKDLDTYNSGRDDISNAKAVLMADISNYDSDVISGDGNIILYSQYLQETQQANVEDTNLQAQQDSMILYVIEQMSEQMINHVNNWEKANKEQNNESVTAKLERYKERVKTFEQRLNIDLSSREKMIDSQMDDMIKEKLALKEQVDSLELSDDFGKRFTPQQELSAEQAFWLRMSNPTSKPSDASPVKIEAPKELPKVSLVNESLKKLKFHLARFDNVVKIRTTPDARTEGEWGFEHTKAVFNNEIIPFLKSLKDIFNVFDRDLLNEIMEVQTVFDQMDAAVQQSSVDKQCLEIAKKELLLENDRLLQQIMSQDVLLTVMNSMSLFGESMNMDRKRNESCDKCFNLEAELLKSQNVHNDLLKKFFENNDLKAQLQDKDTTICKLKEIIKSMREKSKEENVNYDYCELETKNVELENSVAKLLSENERLCNEINHVKQVFKEQFNSIKKTRVHTKEQGDSLIDKMNLKSAEYEDLKAQIQDKVFMITSLKNDLQKVKGKEIVDIAAQIPSANNIVPGMFKLDLEPLAPRLLQNREVHIDYLKYTQE
ncbi:hypothetical protein Tco_0414121 [Tanacetum coccineum]